MKTVSEIIASELKKNKINSIFMLTGYGAMYLNDAVEKSKIKYYAARNEAAAPMMAEAYAKCNGNIGAVCVTAGPGATNALPGLAEAYVDSSPIIVISGQVEKKFSADNYKKIFLRSLGTAEFSVTRVVKNITKYSVTIRNPYDCLYEIQKALYLCKSGRPGPVWIEIPLDVQAFKIKNVKKLRNFKIKEKKKAKINLHRLTKGLNSSKKPLFIIGNGLKQSKTEREFRKFVKKYKIPFVTSRFALDLFPYSMRENMGLLGIKGTLYGEKLIKECDLIVSLGCRLAPTLTFGNASYFSKNKRIFSINNDKNELENPLININQKIHADLNTFFKSIKKNKIKIKNNEWLNRCIDIKKSNPIKDIYKKSYPLNLYQFMYELCENSNKKHILVTDAGSNYYVGGQAWRFEKGQKEIASTTNAAMGLSIPLSVGAAVGSNRQVLSVTGDGSIELNIQELKTISHYNLNIKTFVINNGGYASMKKWQDDYFKGNRLDTEEKTGVGTMNFKKIAEAFDLKYTQIKKASEIRNKLKIIFSNKKPMIIEVFTDPNQKIYGKKS